MHCYPFNFHWAAPYNDVHLPFEYVSKKMITKEILGDFNVSETAERCGFHDISYFSNLFKTIRGYSPSSVRKKRTLKYKKS